MKLDEVLSSESDTLTTKRVYGEPYEKSGVTVIPAATFRAAPAAGTATTRRVRGARAAVWA